MADEMKKDNIVLVGFMGTGKSAVGGRLAAKLSRRFVDLDGLIEKRAGKPIPLIFKEDGEPRFRELERELVQEVASQEGLVVAAGGGVVLNPANIEDLGRTGLVVCLSASGVELIRRLQSSTDRPLLAEGDIEQKISELLGRRQKLYDAISCQVDTSGLTVDEVAVRIIGLFDNIS